MIEQSLRRASVARRSVQPGMPPDCKIYQLRFPFRFEYRVERGIDRLAPDFPGSELLSQPGPAHRLGAQPGPGESLGKPPVLNQTHFLQAVYALIHRPGVCQTPALEPVSKLDLALRPRREPLQCCPHRAPECGRGCRIFSCQFITTATLGCFSRCAAGAPRTLYLLTVSDPSRSQLTNCFVSGLLASIGDVRLRERSISSRA